MKKSLLLKLSLLILTFSMLTGCLLIPVDDGMDRGGSHDRSRGDRHGDRHSVPPGHR